MYEQMFADMKSRMQPAIELAETNKQILEKLVTLQKNSTHELVNASLEQFKALSQVKEPQAALDLQVKFYKALEAKMTVAAEQNIAVITEAKEAFTAAVEGAAKQTVEDTNAAVKKAAGTAA